MINLSVWFIINVFFFIIFDKSIYLAINLFFQVFLILSFYVKSTPRPFILLYDVINTFLLIKAIYA